MNEKQESRKVVAGLGLGVGVVGSVIAFSGLITGGSGGSAFGIGLIMAAIGFAVALFGTGEAG